jgi:hypothetical protein
MKAHLKYGTVRRRPAMKAGQKDDCTLREPAALAALSASLTRQEPTESRMTTYLKTLSGLFLLSMSALLAQAAIPQPDPQQPVLPGLANPLSPSAEIVVECSVTTPDGTLGGLCTTCVCFLFRSHKCENQTLNQI